MDVSPLWLQGSILTFLVGFAILGYLAIRFGRQILSIANSQAFRWTMIAFVIVCAVGSTLSIAKWVRRSRKR